MPAGAQGSMSKKPINDDKTVVDRKNSPESKHTPKTINVILRWVLVAIQGWLALVGMAQYRIGAHPQAHILCKINLTLFSLNFAQDCGPTTTKFTSISGTSFTGVQL